MLVELNTPQNFADYELIDCGNFEKLERWGKYITIRPEPQAVWDKSLTNAKWEQLAHVKFVAKSSSAGTWQKLKAMPDQWKISYTINTPKGKGAELTFRLGLTAFKHVGLFPEQAANWDFIYNSIQKLKTPTPKFLNLFAYTGAASLAAKAAGADVTHVDSIKQVVTWSKENMELSGLENIRWVVEDAMKFVKREVKRGNKYNGIILDPPAYGHGPSGESWKLEKDINEMLKLVTQLLDKKDGFLILNTYSLGFSSLIINNLLNDFKVSTGELYLKATHGNILPLGVYGKI